MGVFQNLYVGPYARWLVEGRVDDEALRDLLGGIDHALATNAWGLAGQPPEVRLNGTPYRCYCFMPDADRPGQPGRELWFGGALHRVEDWTDLGWKREVDWFAHAFARELGRLAEFFGSPASLRWGMVAWPG